MNSATTLDLSAAVAALPSNPSSDLAGFSAGFCAGGGSSGGNPSMTLYFTVTSGSGGLKEVGAAVGCAAAWRDGACLAVAGCGAAASCEALLGEALL